jgi:hypothetical protein
VELKANTVLRTLLKRRLTAFVSPAGGKRRRALGLAAGLALASGFALAQGKPNTSQLAAGPIEISAVPIEYFERNGDPQARARTQYGKLRWLGGLVLTSASPGFGGWSGLAFDPEGKRLLAISDAGSWMTAELVYAKRRLVGLANAEIGPLKATGGKPLLKPRDRDAEAVSLASGTLESGSLLIAFERNNRIGKFAVEGGKVSPPAAYLKMPQESRQMRTNGFESVSMLRDGPYKGSVIAFAEQKLPRQSLHTGWIWVGNEPKRLSLTDIDGFDVTDVAALADGGILVLERRFRWAEGVRMRLRRIAAAGIEPGATLDGEILIEADMGREIDNMEGLAVREGPRGETLVTMISDDNFNSFLQRTVLLEFALDSGASVKVESETPSPVQAGAPAAPVPVNSR